MKRYAWKQLLTGGLAVLLLSGSSALAEGRPPADPALYRLYTPSTIKSEPTPYVQAEPAAAALVPESVPVAEPEPAVQAEPEQPSRPDPQPVKQKQAAVERKAAVKQTASPERQVKTSSGKAVTYKKVISAKASAYTAAPEENGGYEGIDYFGNPLKLGTIAVDPDVIPLGSTVYITGYTYDGLPAGGMFAKATDIGGAINGSRVDIFLPTSREQAMRFGIQKVNIYVIE